MAIQKITEVSVAASLSASENPTFYVEKNGTFKRVTLARLKDLLLDGTANVFADDTAYNEGDYVIYDGILYRFTADHPAGAWTGTDASACTMADEISLVKSHLEAIGFTVVDGAVNITYEEG